MTDEIFKAHYIDGFSISSGTIFSISLLSCPLSLVLLILFFCSIVLSSADTFRMPLASMSKHTVNIKRERADVVLLLPHIGG